MRKLFEWYSQLSAWYQAAAFGLFFAIMLAVVGGLAFGKFSSAIYGLAFGLIFGLVNYWQQRRDAGEGDEVAGYPEQLEIVERRHAKQFLMLLPTFWLIGIALSWIIVGTGWYGVLAGLVAAAVIWWALGRFGGPSDPRWKRVKDDWMRRSREAH